MWFQLKSPLLVVLLSSFACGDDWPQWLGPNRDGVFKETGIIQSIPTRGLPVKWRVPVKHGYSGPAVADGRVFVMDYDIESGKLVNNPGGINKLTGKERILCFATDTGDLLWEHSYDQPYSISYAGGPRCTPTIDQGKVYTLGAEGKLSCLDATNGEMIWEKSLTAEYDTTTAHWGYASHPLVEGDMVYTIVGGDGSVCVAFDKHTGQEVWTALSAPEPGYCSPTMITHGGAKQLLIWHPDSLNSLNPKTGQVFWSIPLRPNHNMSIMGPRKWGSYLYASAIGNISALMKLDDDQPKAEIVWRGNAKTSVYCSNSTPFLEDGMIYGCDVETGALIGAELNDGARLWQTTQPTDNSERRTRHATVFLVKHEDRFFLFNELGDFIIAKLSRNGYEEQGRFHVLEPTNETFGRKVVWSHPAFAEQCLFARNDEELVCVDLAAYE